MKLSQAEPMQIVDAPSKSDEEIFKLDRLVIPKSGEKSEDSKEIGARVANVIENAINAIGNRHAKLTLNVELFH